MIKRFLYTFILITVLILPATAYSKTVKIGCVEDYYPYITITKNGELGGILIDWWKLWSKKTGVDIEFVPLDLQSSIDKTLNGEIDIIAGFLYSEERAKILDFSESLMRTRTVLFLKNEVKTDSIKNLNVAINLVENDLAHLYIKKHWPDVKLIKFKSYAALMNAIYLKEVDGFTYDIPNPVGKYKEPSPPEGYYIFETLFAGGMRPAVKKGNSEMLNLIMSGSDKISNQELIEIVNKWKMFKKDNSIIWYSLVIAILVGLFIGLLAFRYFRKRNIAEKQPALETYDEWRSIIENGETDSVEFKSSMRWDYR